MPPRMFVSIDLPPPLSEEIAAVQTWFNDLSGVQCTDPSQAHVTLKFLGEVVDEEIPAVIESLEQGVQNTEVQQFSATIGHFGVFPEYDYISVIWLGVPVGGTAMETLHESIDAELRTLGYPPEHHQFTPHVTIARMDHGERKETVQELLRTRDPVIGTMSVDRISLIESTLTHDGPEYEQVASIHLA